MLEELFKKLGSVPSVPSGKIPREPLQATNDGPVPPVPPVPSEKTKVEVQNSNVIITCFACKHFQSFNKHGRGAGSCAVHASTNGVCHWHDHKHQCNRFEENYE